MAKTASPSLEGRTIICPGTLEIVLEHYIVPFSFRNSGQIHVLLNRQKLYSAHIISYIFHIYYIKVYIYTGDLIPKLL